MSYINPNRNTTLGFRSSRDFATRVDNLSEQLGSCRSEVLRLAVSDFIRNNLEPDYFAKSKLQLF